MRLIMILTTACLLSACAKGSGSSSDSAQSAKSIFSKWTSGAKVVDVSGGQFGVPFPIATILTSGAICIGQMTISGDNSSGIYLEQNAYWSGGGASDPGCAALDGGGTYSNDGTTLTVCRNGTCATYN